MPLVQNLEDEHRDDVETSRNGVGLGQTKKEASGDEARVVLHETLSDGDASENNHACRD